MTRSKQTRKIYVTTGKDGINTKGSLRRAVLKVNLSLGTIRQIIICTHERIILTGGEIIISSDVEIINGTCGDVTISAKEANSRIFFVTSNDFKIISPEDKIILKGGRSNANGGAIYVENAGNKTILQGVTIRKCTATRAGGAIYTMGELFLLSSNIISNSAGTQGGGIWSEKDVTLKGSNVIKNATTIPNKANGGGGIFVDGGNCTLDCSVVSRNSVAYILGVGGGSGGGIVVLSGSIAVQNNSHVDYNTAYNAGGIQEGIGNVTVSNGSSVSHNESFNDSTGSAGGGGITITLGVVSISASKISHNKTKGMYSGGIVSLVGDVLVTNGSKICSNSNRGPGGGIATNVGSVIIDSSTICRNVGASLGGGIVSFIPSPGFISLTHSKVIDNVLTNAETIRQTIAAFIDVITENLSDIGSQASESGGAGGQAFIAKIPDIIAQVAVIKAKLDQLNIYTGNVIGGGGIACLLPTFVTIDDSIISRNFAGKMVTDEASNYPFNAFGGGIFSFGGELSINDTEIEANRSTSEAGGILSKSKLTLTRSKISCNASVDHAGGLLNDVDGKATLVDTIVQQNIVDKNGGGIVNRGDLELISSKVINNIAGITGGGVFSNGEFLHVDTDITNNKPNNVIIY